jgi:hypothetical protein
MKGRNMVKFQTLCRSAIVIWIWNGFSALGTVYHSDGSAASVQGLHNQVLDGDTITLPAGTFVWNTGVTITKGITLQGQTTTNPDNGTANDLTIIQDSNARRRPGGWPFITVNTGNSRGGKSFRITGLTFDAGQATSQNNNGAIVLNGQNRSVRIDHTNWHGNLTSGGIKESVFIQVSGAVCGVADHNVFIMPGSIASFHMDNGDTWPNPNGSIGSNGDGAFAAPTRFGGPDFFFVEDNYFRGRSSSPTGGPDDLRGGRWVWRYNHMFNVQVQSHGTEDGRWHGGRAREVYHNDFHASSTFGDGGIRSGVTVYHHNTWTGTAPGASGYQLQAYRTAFKWPNCPFGGATGDNPWDSNDLHGLYDSGTAGARSDGSHIVDTTKNWIPNRWINYTAKFPGDNQVALILGNTSNTLNVFRYTDSVGGHTWQTGDHYEIHKVMIALDQPGRGKGDLITGNPPVNSTTGTASWPHQALEPSYAWNNKYHGVQRSNVFTVGTGGSNTLVAGRDYFNNTPMPGYVPYTYPHPLVSNASPTPISPP